MPEKGVLFVQVGPNLWALGDAKNPNGPFLLYTDAEWAAFISGVEGGEFDA